MRIKKSDFYGQTGGDDPITLLRPLPPPPLLPRPVIIIEREILKYLRKYPDQAVSFNEIFENVQGIILKEPLPFLLNIALAHLIHTGKIDGKYIAELGEWYYILKSE